MSCLTLRTADVYIFFRPQTFWLDIRSVMTYILVVVWLDISIVSAPYLRQRVLIIHFTVLFVIAFSAFHSIRSRIFHPLHAGAVFSSLAFSTPAFLTVPRFPFSQFSRPLRRPSFSSRRCTNLEQSSTAQHITSAPSLPVFCSRLKTYLFELCYL